MSFVKRIFGIFLTLSFFYSLLPQWEVPQPVPVIPAAKEEPPQMILPVGEKPASYPYGDERLKEFIKNQLKWPVRDFSGEGTVVIRFTVDEKGYPSDYKIIRGFHPAFNREALRVIKMIKKWKPGSDHLGKPATTLMNMPVRFALH